MPNVSYFHTPKIVATSEQPFNLPDPSVIEKVEEPYISAQLLQNLDTLALSSHIEKRGVLKNQIYLSTDRVELSFELPLLK